MMLSEGDRKIIIAALQWAGIEHDRQSKDAMKRLAITEAREKAQFAEYCASLADRLTAGN